jgi:hypothetical protein
MSPAKAHVAHVRNGRLLLDEPTDLPEGTAVELYVDDDLDEEELQQIDEAVERSHADLLAGRTVSLPELMQRLRAD